MKEAVYEKSGQLMNCNKDIFTLIFAAVSNTNILGSLFLYELWYLLHDLSKLVLNKYCG